MTLFSMILWWGYIDIDVLKPWNIHNLTCVGDQDFLGTVFPYLKLSILTHQFQSFCGRKDMRNGEVDDSYCVEI